MIGEVIIGPATLDGIIDNTYRIKLTGDRIEEKRAFARTAMPSLYEEIFMALPTMAQIWSLTTRDGGSFCSGLAVYRPHLMVSSLGELPIEMVGKPKKRIIV